LAALLNVSPNSGVMMSLEWLGLLDDAPTSGQATRLDILADQMLDKMPYLDGERDMVVLVHEFVAAYPDQKKHITSTLIDFGTPGGDTSMARTVGLPAAIGARMILDGELDLTGVHIPVLPEIYRPVLEELAQRGIVCAEKTELLT
jgi:saccharopine dehydrogenase (NADP+, L-glutamate forming)/spermidine synthase